MVRIGSARAELEGSNHARIAESSQGRKSKSNQVGVILRSNGQGGKAHEAPSHLLAT